MIDDICDHINEQIKLYSSSDPLFKLNRPQYVTINRDKYGAVQFANLKDLKIVKSYDDKVYLNKDGYDSLLEEIRQLRIINSKLLMNAYEDKLKIEAMRDRINAMKSKFDLEYFRSLYRKRGRFRRKLHIESVEHQKVKLKHLRIFT